MLRQLVKEGLAVKSGNTNRRQLRKAGHNAGQSVLDSHVLILNRSWVAVNISTVRRAVGLIYQGHARAVHPSDYSLYDFDDWCSLSDDETSSRFLNTPSSSIRVPEVILLKFFNRFVHREVRFSRRNIFERDRNVCQYCGKNFSKVHITIDHVIPRSRGGRDTWENLVVACARCNVTKGSRTPKEAKMPLLRKPAKPSWLPPLGSRVPNSSIVSWKRFVDTARWYIASNKDNEDVEVQEG